MKRLLTLEWIKLRAYPTFWILLGLHLGLIALIARLGQNFQFTSDINGTSNTLDFSQLPLFQFPYIWHNLTYMAGYFKFILAVFVIVSITNELDYRMLRQHIIDGLSRGEFLLAKVLQLLTLSLLSAFFVLVLGLAWGKLPGENPGPGLIFEQMEFVAAYALQLFAYLIFALFAALLIRKTGLVIMLFLLYSFVLEYVLLYLLPNSYEQFLPFYAINKLIESPFQQFLGMDVQTSVSVVAVFKVLLYSLGSMAFSYLLLHKRDL